MTWNKARIDPLRALTRTIDCDQHIISAMWSMEFEDTWQFMIIVNITSEPYLQRSDHQKRSYIVSIFCAVGFSFVCMQPTIDEKPLAMMRIEIADSKCEFLKSTAKNAHHFQVHFIWRQKVHKNGEPAPF